MLWLLWIVVLICAVWVALGALPAGTEGRIPLPYFIALIQFLWIPTLATSLAALAMREYALACCAIGVGIASRIRQAGYWSRVASPKDLAAALKSRGRPGSPPAEATRRRDRRATAPRRPRPWPGHCAIPNMKRRRMCSTSSSRSRPRRPSP